MATPTLFSFSKDLQKLAEIVDINLATVVQKVATDLFARIVGNFPAHRHPVDTGRARSGWGLSIGAPTVPTPPKGKYPEPPSFPDVAQIDGTQEVFIVNNLAYVEALENGHSKQAPNGFVKLAMMEVEADIASTTNL
jgi:hypothetical protein